ncbi:MAG: glycogen debranching enzyme family protein [Leptolyngbya sp.]|nr:glycogen debranching enzyme family protein [Candidatus Melainabacteria bacterium]
MPDFDLEQFLLQQVGDSGQSFHPVLLTEKTLSEKTDIEWLSTNGLGSYASQSVAGANTRRYHGLMVASLEPPVKRTVLLSRIDEVVECTAGGGAIELATNYWQSGAVAPNGHEYLQAFTNLPVPTWLYKVPHGHLVKQITMIHGEQSVAIGYTWLPASDAKDSSLSLQLAIFGNYRDFHNQTSGNNDWQFQQVENDNAVIVSASDDALPWYFCWSQGRYSIQPSWYWGYSWPAEWERGLADSEDLFRLGHLDTVLLPGKTLTLTAGLGLESVVRDINQEVANEWSRKTALTQRTRTQSDLVKQLIYAGEQFVVKRQSTGGNSIIAGYHWFGDWGRDSMISLPGLLIETGQLELARSVLTTFGLYVSEGMLPNYFPDSGQSPEYNTLDATLWWAVAVDEYYRNTADLPFLMAQVPLLDKVVFWHLKGTRHGIKVDPVDGLVSGGQPDIQLTWMDAKCGDYVVTPRQGKAVEINALWFNFLKTLELLHMTIASAIVGSEGAEYDMQMGFCTRYATMAEQVRAGFKSFWNSNEGCLFDVIGADGFVDPSIRPNQLFAVSLPFKVITPEEATSILNVVERELLTDYGLRTLSPRDPAYKGLYGETTGQANQYHRDITYHQGTVWPWLLGHWVDARVAVVGSLDQNFEVIADRLLPLLRHMIEEGCIGSISEIFDGDEPHRPMGCVAQAWSVAELTRILLKYPQISAILETKMSPQAVAL